jgi:hypothetical protein
VTVSGRLLLLIGGALAFWLLAGLPARALGGGDVALAYCGTAVLLCLLPAVATLLWAGSALKGDPQQQLLMVLGGTGLRLFGVLLAALALHAYVPFYREQDGFWAWLVVSYLVVLALEVALLLAGRSRLDRPS